MNPIIKKLLLIVIFCCAGLLSFGQEGISMTMADAVKYAMANSQEVQIARLNIEDAEQQIIQTRATGLPQITGEASYNYFFKVPTSVLPSAFEELIRLGNGGELPPGFSNQVSFALKNQFQAGINLQTMVFDGSFFTGLRAATLYRTLAQDELAAKQQDLRSRVIEVYLPAIILNENLKILDKNISNVDKLLIETQALYKEGFVEQLDVDRLVLSMANLQTERENLAREYDVAVNSLKLTINYPMEKKLQIADIEEWRNVIIPVSKEDLIGPISYYNRQNYKAAETGIQLNDLNTEYTKKQYLPKLNLNASYNQAFQGDKLFNDPNSFWAPTGIVGLSLSVPIWDGMGKGAKIEKARLATQISRAQQEQLRQVIDMEIANARIRYKSAVEKLTNQEKNLALAERIYETTQIKYKEGVGSSLEIAQAEQSLFDSQRNYTTALFDLLTSKLSLYRALGK